METKELTPTQEKRERLREISNRAQALREKMLHNTDGDKEVHDVNDLTINEIIISNFYKSEINTEFNTFKGWIKKGFCVDKGEKAFVIWGRPKKIEKKNLNEATEDEKKKGNFFPLSFIFSNAQVSPLKKKDNA